MEKVFEIYIKTTPGAAVGGDHRPASCAASTTFGVGVDVRLDAGLAATGRRTESAGVPLSEGENLEVDPPRRLVQSFNALWSDDVRPRAPRG